MSINTTLNSTVVFYCEGTGDDLSFTVNAEPADDEAVIAKGFTGTSTNNGGTRRAELQAIAYEHNNNTNISCTAITLSPLQTETSNISVLMIQG